MKALRKNWASLFFFFSYNSDKRFTWVKDKDEKILLHSIFKVYKNISIDLFCLESAESLVEGLSNSRGILRSSRDFTVRSTNWDISDGEVVLGSSWNSEWDWWSSTVDVNGDWGESSGSISPLKMELLVVSVPSGNEVEDSSPDSSSSGSSGLNSATERSSLSSWRYTSDSDDIVRSRVKSSDGEGSAGSSDVDPESSSVNLVRNLP